MPDCQKPGCTKSSSDTYTDEHGNELALCSTHYYELVSGETVREGLSPSTGVGVELTREIESGGAGILDGVDRDIGVRNGTTPCPDCGKPMGMVSWTGEKPSCHRCAETPTDKFGPMWLGVIDPNTGRKIGPTMNEYTDTSQNDVRIPEPQTF